MLQERMREFSTLYEQEAGRLVRSVSLVTGEPGLAEDAVAEAFAKAWSRWGHVRTHERPAAWIMRVALNECHSRFRRRKVAQRLAHRVSQPATIHDPEPTASPVWEAVARLPERDRVLVALRYIADLAQPEVAHALGIPAGTVASSLHRIRRQLGIELSPVYEEGMP